MNDLVRPTLNILHLEDSPEDGELIREHLAGWGKAFSIELVTTKAEFISAIRSRTHQLVLADFSLPGFDALAALRVLKSEGIDLPFICVSGAIGEEKAVELLQEGATDYVLKSRLEKLPLAMNRALAEVAQKIAHRQAELQLKRSEERYQSLIRTWMDGFIVVDMEGRILETNDALCHMLGRSQETLLSLHLFDLMQTKVLADVFDDFDEFLEQGWERFETAMLQANGSTVEVQISAIQVQTEGIIVCFVSNIGERKSYEKQIERALREKETLIRELYHRTKNTIQVVRSLMELQAMDYPKNKELQRLVKTTENRIKSISLVHQLLYQSRDLSRISLNDYLHELSESILKGLAPSPGRIVLALHIDDRHVLLDTAVPFGLIVNELMTNSLRHGFPDNRSGTIHIEVTPADSTQIVFRYSDDGIGVPEGFDFRSQDSLGLKLIFSLGEEQLSGKITMERSSGVSFSLTFPNSLYQTRL